MVLVSINDDMIEAWFSRYRGLVGETSDEALAAVAPWLPIIGIAANDRSAHSPARARTATAKSRSGHAHNFTVTRT